MPTPQKQIRKFLVDNAVPEPRCLQTSILFAQSMLRELEAASIRWRAALATLEEIQREDGRELARRN